jgi:acylglycerol lipase
MFTWEEKLFQPRLGTSVFYRACLPPCPKGHLLFLHGYGEHSGRYCHVLEYFAEHGYAAFAPDLRGHGRTARCLGDLEGFEKVLADLMAFTGHLREAHGARNLFVAGHSLGGSLALCLGSRLPEAVKGVAVLSPVILIPAFVSPLLVTLSGMLAALAPRLPVMRLADESVFQGEREALHERQDPLVYRGRMRARTGFEMLKAMEITQALLPGLMQPLLVIHPGHDKMNPRRASEKVYRESASPDKIFHLCEHGGHNILNEPEKEDALNRMMNWIEQHNPHEAATAFAAPAASHTVTAPSAVTVFPAAPAGQAASA